ncbi:hypothetical protein HS088_TW20G00721 [Tripterygium wilfordii]|uniref:Uncharacterized protein n=1 Tax=Tripterygium wilfordii TaxID=458696 RepID=A0A7J7C880_TRIWF|nr:uncharacterized protein LOC119986730 [Tripterygium wilfordii]KAF5730348.1 hypothetical protein HS088_TW20G00721 [Tripterygium wilfordii]
MCSETSPRISFSQDLGQEDDASIEQVVSRRDLSLLDSNSDFEFSICSNFDHDSSLADELFLNGMILPVQVQDRVSAPKQAQQHKHNITPLLSLPPLPSSSSSENSRKESMKEFPFPSSDLDEKSQSNNKSFWGFKRSSSLNCDIKRSLIRSLPLLSRSNSTGSVPNPKQTTLKDIQRQNQQKQQLTAKSSSSSSPAAATYIYPLSQKPPLKKNHGNRIRISPLLNVLPPSIPRGTGSFLGLGFLYKDKKNKK